MEIINIDDEADEEYYQELSDVLVGSGSYQIVGIRYYTGVVRPGQYVNLVREPNNRKPASCSIALFSHFYFAIGFVSNDYYLTFSFYYLTIIFVLHTAYDRNAIRVDNIHGEKVGHIKATMAKLLASVMDRQRVIRIQGTVPREGDKFT